jgi:hypothetical protein
MVKYTGSKLRIFMFKELVKDNFIYYFFHLVFGLVYGVLYFPIWWYSLGTIRAAKGLFSMVVNEEKSLAFFVWVKNLFRPMYGVGGWDGLLISFFVRLAQIAVRGIALVIWIIIAFILFLVWLALPIIVIGQIFYQLS